jgi:DNA-binding CsgD family transcriptional regulator
MARDVVGREQELGSVDAFFERPDEGPAAFVLEGETGIGKSTLWLAGVAAARDRGLRVLSSRPAEAERGLAHVVLGDLFDAVLDDVLPALTAARRRALEAALLVDEALEEPVDPRALGVAVRSVFEVLAERGPLVIAVDDDQWLDASSASALRFALRRLRGQRVLLLLARRAGLQPAAGGVEEAIAANAVERLRVGPLSVGALQLLLRRRIERTFPRRVLVRLLEVSGGNPFYALELARGLAADGERADPTEPFPVPESLERLATVRIERLDPATREALLVVAAHGRPTAALLGAAGIAPDLLDPAVETGAVEISRGLVRFSHPLLASALYQSASRGDRRRAHARLAAIVDDAVDRGRHLALAADGPDPEIAALLDVCATTAQARGAMLAAAELAEQALRLTPPERRENRHRRALAAAHAQRAAGEWTRAQSTATELLTETDESSLRAEALILLAELESVDRAVVLLEEALGEAASHPALRSEIHCRLAWTTRFRKGYVSALEHARVALELADELRDDELRARAVLVQAILGWIVGDADAPPLPMHALDFAAALGGERLVQEATLVVVNTFAPASKREEARALLEREYRDWRERDEPRSARSLWGLAWVEFWAGRWELAAEHAAQAHDVSIQYGLEVPQDHLPIALVAAHRGRLDLAREHSERALALAEEQFALHPPQHMAILGLVALARGDADEGAAWLDRADRQAAALGWGEPSIRWWTCDHVELLLELGRVDDAVRVLDAWESDAARLDREWVLAHVTRCRGLVAAARGEVEQAPALLEQAVAEHEAVGDPFGRARALLALGIVRRRTRQKRPAREAIEAALEGFEALGAAGWAAKARAEAGRVGGRSRTEGLTSAERRVAVLVAEGRTNREVAAALFLGERTVASHLTRVYAKLGVRSRTELARRLDPDQPE